MRRLALLTALLAAASASAQPVPAGTTLDGIAAVVGDQIVLRSEVDALAQQFSQGQPITDEFWSRALDRLVEQKVVIAHARRDTTLNVTEDMVDSQVDQQVQGLVAQVGGEAQLEAAYGRSLEQVRQSVREDVRDEILLQQYQNRRLQNVTITPGEVRSWFAQIPEADRPMVPELVRVAHIVRVPAPNDDAKEAIRARLQGIRDSVVAGQLTLEDAANRYSTDPGNTNRDGTKNGGRYDGFRLGDLEAQFRAAAAASEIGAVSPVFETPFGYHILRVNERTGDRVSFNHVLLAVPTGGAEVEQARAFLTVLRDSVEAGMPFEALARRHSEDPYSASRGGFVSDPQSRQRDLSVEALGAQWKATLDTLEVGAYSLPSSVRLLDGTEAVHIVWLQKRTPSHRLSIADDYALLSQYALQDKRQEELGDWVGDLRRSVYVDIRADRYRPVTSS